uniref:Uncharacterized protein n=1 Tax=Caenorhabditis japonica TaxID=281687 RepID=A0A8R1HW73_CAEJA
MKKIIPLLLILTFSNICSESAHAPHSDTMFLALVCMEECEIDVRFVGEHRNGSQVTLFDFKWSGSNGTLQETTLDVSEEVNHVEFEYTVPDENGTTTETDVWDLNRSESYFHSVRSLQVVGNLPCGKYGCPQTPLCDSGCRFTVVVSLAAFCLCVIAGLLLQTALVSVVGFRRVRKDIELRDRVRLNSNAS